MKTTVYKFDLDKYILAIMVIFYVIHIFLWSFKGFDYMLMGLFVMGLMVVKVEGN